MDIEEIKREFKNKKKYKSNNTKNNNINKPLSKFLITIIITLVTLITLKSSTKIKTLFYENVLDKNISFAAFNKLFKDKFGKPIPFSNIIEKNETKQVFSEKLSYTEKSKYLDGVKLKVSKNYMVPNIENGIIVFIGEKENYGNTIIVEGTDGVDIWYSNISSNSLKLYDYLKKGDLIGEAKDDYIYLVYKKEGKVLNYEDYL